ncbi:ATP-binding protein [Alphaproteobacteria bacterium US3C007]|nr:ATP-binding protein [Alphaproteobacteria bacterium US3C007]
MSWHKIADIFTWLRRKFTLGHFASTSTPSASSFHARRCHLIGDCLPFFRLDENGQVLFSNLAATKLLKQAHSQTEITQALKRAPLFPKTLNLNGCSGTFRFLQNRLETGEHEVFLVPNWMKEGVAPTPHDDFERVPVPMAELSPQGVIIRANSQASRLLGLRAGETPTIEEVMEGLGRALADWLRDATLGRGLKQPEFLRLSRPERETFVQVSLHKDMANRRSSLTAVFTDATELKSLEAQFVQSQKMQAIGQLAGGVAHDFNNLLTAITGHCDLLLLRHKKTDQDYDDLLQINQNANRAAALVSQLLAFSRKQTLRPQNLEIRETLSDLTHLLDRLVGEKVQLRLEYDPVKRAVRADKRQLEQVVMNLVVNARDSMPEGGEILISTAGTEICEPMLRDRVAVPKGAYVSISIQDKGCGIASDKLQKIFEPFYTTKRTGEGTGLGLSTVYGIVKQTGGYIFVDSSVGQGTIFTLLLPASDLPSQKAASPPSDIKLVANRPEGGAVLLVEDEATVRTFAARALRLCGYSVLVAESGERALEIAQNPTVKLDLFVTDVVMPGRGGPSWVREALQTRPHIRIIFMSGYAEDKLTADQSSVPNSIFLAKPFSLTQLASAVESQMP